jgi:hypothetical protein
MMMEAAGTSETLVNFTRLHGATEDSHLHNQILSVSKLLPDYMALQPKDSHLHNQILSITHNIINHNHCSPMHNPKLLSTSHLQ